MDQQKDDCSKKATPGEKSQNKRIKVSPSKSGRVFPPPAQLALFERIKATNAASSKDIKISRKWYVQWEAYCLGLSTLPPPPMYLSQTDDPDSYIAMQQKIVFYLRDWYGAADELLELNLDLSDHQVPSNNVIFSRKHRSAKGLVRTADISDDDDGDDGDDGKLLRFKIYIVGKPVSGSSYSFTISADSSVPSFQSSLLNALNSYSYGTDMELWLLNQGNTSFINKLNNDAGFALSSALLRNSDRFAYKIVSSSISFESTISSCLSQMPKSYKSDQGNIYLLAVEYVKKVPLLPLAPPTSSKRNILGLVGLQNLGNTCYMNSALQCLSNTPQLTRYFLSGDYRHDINTSNALGLNGDLAKAYAKLLRDIWAINSRSSSLSPKDFKSTFERFNPHFTGYLQQDSQELLSFLLDGMHEDLNRILDKPYIEIPDFDDHLRDDEIADRFWNYHKSRNDSIMVDLFQGQYKSRLVCEECKKMSITFDPFMYISLPLPVDKCEINIVCVPYIPSQRQFKMKILLERDASIRQLKQEIEKTIISGSLSTRHDHSLLVVEIYFQKIHRIFKEADPIRTIKPSDTIYVYQLPCSSTEKNDENWVVFPVYCSTTFDKMNPVSVSVSRFGLPTVLAIRAEELRDTSDLYNTICSHIERYCMLKLFEEDNSALLSPSVPETATLFVQQPIHTAAAVTPAGGRPMVPMPNLFHIHVFEYGNSLESFKFPVGESQIQWYSANEPLKQGRGVIIEWSTSKAQQFFGASATDSKINTDAWFDYGHEENSSGNESCSRDNKKNPRLNTFDDCLDEFTGDEKLDNEDSWYCPRCKKHQRALKKIDIWKLPEIMVVHLKRFSQVRRWGNKIDTMIDFPLKGLDMTDRVLGHQNETLIYDLYAVDNHYGGMSGGHYTAFARNIDDSKWYEFNDTHVTPISSKDVKTSAAYLLFYQRRRY